MPRSNANSSNPAPTSEFPRATTIAPGDWRACAITRRGTEFRVAIATATFTASKINSSAAKDAKNCRFVMPNQPPPHILEVDVNELGALPGENQDQHRQHAPPSTPKPPVRYRNRKAGGSFIALPA